MTPSVSNGWQGLAAHPGAALRPAKGVHNMDALFGRLRPLNAQVQSGDPARALSPPLRVRKRRRRPATGGASSRAANSWRTPPSPLRVWLRSRASARDPRGARRPASTSTAFLRRRSRVEDAANDRAIGEHVIFIIVPLAGRAGGRCALEDQRTVRDFKANHWLFCSPSMCEAWEKTCAYSRKRQARFQTSSGVESPYATSASFLRGNPLVIATPPGSKSETYHSSWMSRLRRFRSQRNLSMLSQSSWRAYPSIADARTRGRISCFTSAAPFW